MSDSASTAASYPRSLFTDPSRFLTRAECAALCKRVLSYAAQVAETGVFGQSTGNFRWALNRPSTSGDVTNAGISVTSFFGVAGGQMSINSLDDASLQAAAAESIRLSHFTGGFKRLAASKYETDPGPLQQLGPQTYLAPQLWSEATLALDAPARSDVARKMASLAEKAGFRSAGYIEAAVSGDAMANSANLFAYYAVTSAQYSVTVRTPDGTGSGWAGASNYDWARIDPAKLTEIAVEKCKASANPFALEPGRYTLILEPQAVADMIGMVMGSLSRQEAEQGLTVFSDPKSSDHTKIGQKVLDERITLSEDPMDPENGYVPFAGDGYPLKAETWIERGVLKQLATYELRSSGSFRMDGGETSVEEMIRTTRRGLLVTRFNRVDEMDRKSLLSIGNTRDGLWLIENGRVKQPIKNFRFTESPMFIFNNLEQLGHPIRVFSPHFAITVPPLKVRDFNFTSLSDAV